MNICFSYSLSFKQQHLKDLSNAGKERDRPIARRVFLRFAFFVGRKDFSFLLSGGEVRDGETRIENVRKWVYD